MLTIVFSIRLDPNIVYGCRYVVFYDVMSVSMAIVLSGQPLLGQPVTVKPSEAEKNLVLCTTSVAGASGGMIDPYSGGARRLYVGNLHFNMTEDQLRQTLQRFWFCPVCPLEDARNALNLNGQLEIAGRAIKVSAVTDQIMLDIGTNVGDFDDDEDNGLSLKARPRALLMQNLDRSGIATTYALAKLVILFFVSLTALTFASFSAVFSGSLGTAANNITGIALPLPPVLGAPTSVSSLVPSIVSGSMPILPGQLFLLFDKQE
ncbi:hypothetical protein Ddye_004185 [Dipteronia dyeriana]|uniref:Uncharacterized protein n=1 Tax=Dipteronia dyeriana TaxID=168575 RepID=A0AAD9XTP4_9ROSI|nr:hypothetical protein Ddye_004185 [Dipteronia dyeriana]